MGLFKLILFSSIFCIWINPSNAQDSTFYMINEFSFSTNNTLMNNEKFEKLIGFDFSLRHRFKVNQQINPIVGLGYKLTKKYIDQNGEGILSLNNTFMTNNWVSLFLGLRYLPEKLKSFYIELGFSIDSWLGGNFDSDGYLNSPIHGGYHGPITYKNEKMEGAGVNFPLQVSLGYKLKLKKTSLLIFGGYNLATREIQQNFYDLDYSSKNNYLLFGIALLL